MFSRGQKTSLPPKQHFPVAHLINKGSNLQLNFNAMACLGATASRKQQQCTSDSIGTHSILYVHGMQGERRGPAQKRCARDKNDYRGKSLHHHSHYKSSSSSSPPSAVSSSNSSSLSVSMII
jgi:hypothetical protein